MDDIVRTRAETIGDPTFGQSYTGRITCRSGATSRRQSIVARLNQQKTLHVCAASVILYLAYGKSTPTSSDDPGLVRIHQAMKNIQYTMRPGTFLVALSHWSFRIVERLDAPIVTSAYSDSIVPCAVPFDVEFIPRIEEGRLKDMMSESMI
ncbi:hypothetical protein J3R82DRAFT_2968 [Butyriboletus roseoflavus]|nr:hypothetical protein J3R82DRAFT_2968 [Butyriboletus roseoflavus]